MKKPILTYLLAFVVAFGFFAFIGIQKIDKNDAIAKSPAYTLATPEGITKKTKKSRVTYQVSYSYEVAGTSYKLNSDWLDTEAEAMAATPAQVAYATTAPADAMFKSEFDQRDPDESYAGALLKSAGLGLLVALIGTLALMWKFPWLRRA